MSASHPHNFIQCTDGESRSPCPALNALANHGYLPRDGKNLTITELIEALCGVYNLSFPLATMLSVMGVVCCGHGLKLDLNDLAKHNVIEHNGSVVHDDCLPGQHTAPCIPNQELVQNLTHHAGCKEKLSLNDLAQIRADRNAGLSSPLGRLHSKIATGELALTWLVMKDEHNEIPVESIKEWYGEERIPRGWLRPAKPIGILSARSVATRIVTQLKRPRT